MNFLSDRNPGRFLAAPVALAAAIASACASAAPAVTTVYPTGLFPIDVQNVQSAINGGGTVLLKASNVTGTPTAFNFGTPHYLVGSGVSIYNDVELVGERVGGSMTTIAGGFVPVVGAVPAKTRIADIDFDSPGASAIVIVASTGTEIVDNVVNGVTPALLTLGFTETDGIDLFYDGPSKMRVSGNVIRGLTGDFANGMQLDEVAADVDISGNTVIFEQSSGYIQTVGITAFRSHGTVTISRNSIYMGPGSTDAFPAPIFAGGDHEAHYAIVDNDIVVDHPNGDGIELNGGDFSEPTYAAKVSGNRVLIQSTYPGYGGAGITIIGGVNGTIVSGNVIEGSSAFAFQAFQGFLGGEPAIGNRFLGNDISGHSDLTADVFLDSNTSNTLVAGRCATAIDFGVGNRINCGQHGNPQHAAPSLSAKAHARQGLLGDARREIVLRAIKRHAR